MDWCLVNCTKKAILATLLPLYFVLKQHVVHFYAFICLLCSYSCCASAINIVQDSSCTDDIFSYFNVLVGKSAKVESHLLVWAPRCSLHLHGGLTPLAAFVTRSIQQTSGSTQRSHWISNNVQNFQITALDGGVRGWIWTQAEIWCQIWKCTWKLHNALASWCHLF